MANPKFGNRNELSAYQIGKDIANLEAKVELLEKTKGGNGGGLDVLKVIVPAATDEDFNTSSLCVVRLPDYFKNSLILMFMNNSWDYVITEDELGVGLSYDETEIFIIKLTDFKNVKDTVHTVIRTVGGSGAAASDA